MRSQGATTPDSTCLASNWIDRNNYVDELSYAQAYRDHLASIGFDDNLGMLIDTFRNG